MNSLPIELLDMIVSNVCTADLYELSRVNELYYVLCNSRVCSLELIPIMVEQNRMKDNLKVFNTIQYEVWNPFSDKVNVSEFDESYRPLIALDLAM